MSSRLLVLSLLWRLAKHCLHGHFGCSSYSWASLTVEVFESNKPLVVVDDRLAWVPVPLEVATVGRILAAALALAMSHEPLLLLLGEVSEVAARRGALSKRLWCTSHCVCFKLGHVIPRPTARGLLVQMSQTSLIPVFPGRTRVAHAIILRIAACHSSHASIQCYQSADVTIVPVLQGRKTTSIATSLASRCRCI